MLSFFRKLVNKNREILGNRERAYDESFIRIVSIQKSTNKIIVNFNPSDNLKKYFNFFNQEISYRGLESDLSNFPDGIVVIPTISNLLPLIWFYDVNLVVDELDKTFYDNISEIKKGYSKMFPFIEFKGKVSCKNIVDYSYDVKNNSVVLFSQGLDSSNTVINNLDKNLFLLTLHGADLPLEEIEGFKNLSNSITDFASSVNCENIFARSSFRKNLNYAALDNTLPNEMKKSWWHQFQHGIAIISHAVIVAYAKKSNNILIASSLSDECAKFNNVEYNRCASSPIIDNKFKFSSCGVIHDGYEYEKLDKLKNVIDYSKQKGFVRLRVCYTSRNGDNCSKCDKCSRLILSLISENENPLNYGFNVTDESLLDIKNNLDNLKEGIETWGWSRISFTNFFWIQIQENFRNNADKYDYNENVKWILDYNFEDMNWK